MKTSLKSYKDSAESHIEEILFTYGEDLSIISNKPIESILDIQSGISEDLCLTRKPRFDENLFDAFLTEYNKVNGTVYTILDFDRKVFDLFNESLIPEEEEEAELMLWNEYLEGVNANIQFMIIESDEDGYEMLITPGDETGKTMRIVGGFYDISNSLIEDVSEIYGDFIMIIDPLSYDNQNRSIYGTLYTEQFDKGTSFVLNFGYICSKCGDFYKIFPGMTQFCCELNRKEQKRKDSLLINMFGMD